MSGKVRYSKREDKLLALPVPMETATNKSGSATVERNELGRRGRREGEMRREEGEEGGGDEEGGDHLHYLSSCM